MKTVHLCYILRKSVRYCWHFYFHRTCSKLLTMLYPELLLTTGRRSTHQKQAFVDLLTCFWLVDRSIVQLITKKLIDRSFIDRSFDQKKNPSFNYSILLNCIVYFYTVLFSLELIFWKKLWWYKHNIRHWEKRTLPMLFHILRQSFINRPTQQRCMDYLFKGKNWKTKYFWNDP